MSDFITGFIYCAAAAGSIATIIFCARRCSRSSVDELDYGNGRPDGWVEHSTEDHR
ncbi:hypothetical protein [Rhizobium sp. NLR22b]|uniref:hypothetical protein n=1 Tax=Rhizobium sp. NLR22b TaxID=2731115 RepID=UPI001C833697|nr:hypothetical protein [Rhizobium sp. NLR22b]MBX5238663.1 hypothetical protein [Rhizobium sp. NLR22b]